MADALLDGTVTDQNGAVVAGALVYVYDGRGESGDLSALRDSMGQAAVNPVTADANGYWSAYATSDQFYTLVYYWGGRKRSIEANVLLGTAAINTDPNVRPDLASTAAGKGAAMVAYRSRTVKAKLDDWCTPLDFGAVGDGLTDDKAAIDAAMATGKHVVFPRQYTFLTSTSLGHAYSADGQIVEVNGKLQHTGARADLGGGYFGYWALLYARNLERIKLIGSGELNGKRTGGSLVTSDAASGVFWQRVAQGYIDGIKFNDFMEDGVKAPNCPELIVGSAAWFYYCRNMGLEMRSYASNPYAGLVGVGDAWTGTTYGPSGTINGRYEFIDDGLHGAGNGCGVDFSPDDNAPGIGPLRVGGTFLDVNRAIFSENNHTTTSVKDIIIDSPSILGNIRGAATCETYLGIGFINCSSIQIVSPIIRNVGNFAPGPGAHTCGIVLSGANTTEVDIINPQIVDDTGNANRTDYGIILNSNPTNIRIKGGKIEGTSDGEVSMTGSPVRLRIENLDGAETDYTWANVTRYSFSLQNIPASATTTLWADGQTNIDAAILPCAGRVVGAAVRLSTVGAGTFSFKALVAAVEQTGVRVTNTDFGSGASASKKISTKDALQGATGAQLTATVTTDGSWVNTVGAKLDVFVDHGMKL